MTTIKSKIEKSEQGMTLSGELTFASVVDLLEQGNQCLNQHKQDSPFTIDCKSMERIDSAGIALLLEWHRQCKNNNKLCRFEGLSKQAQALIGTYRLKSLIAV